MQVTVVYIGSETSEREISYLTDLIGLNGVAVAQQLLLVVVESMHAVAQSHGRLLVRPQLVVPQGHLTN